MILPVYRHLQDENRRLRKLNAEMLKALVELIEVAEGFSWTGRAVAQARVAVTKAEKER